MRSPNHFLKKRGINLCCGVRKHLETARLYPSVISEFLFKLSSVPRWFLALRSHLTGRRDLKAKATQLLLGWELSQV